jgi:hypothetical protein
MINNQNKPLNRKKRSSKELLRGGEVLYYLGEKQKKVYQYIFDEYIRFHSAKQFENITFQH